MAYVLNLFVARGHGAPMEAVGEAMAVADRGFEGCAHGRPGSKRQILIVDREMLAEFGLGPGTVRENITAAGLRTADLRPGQWLGIGGAVLEVTIRCEPCFRMEEIRAGLQEALKNRRGVLCRVVEGGRITRGDTIEMREAGVAIPSVGGER